jgi:hypothetical protein
VGGPAQIEVAWVLDGVEFAYARFDMTEIGYNVAVWLAIPMADLVRTLFYPARRDLDTCSSWGVPLYSAGSLPVVFL